MIQVIGMPVWRKAHPGAAIGLLEITGVVNDRPSPRLDERKREVETRLRERYQGFTRQELISLPVMAEYRSYYKRFEKTYHVLLQVESVVLKGKDLPSVSPLVDANFSAEMETFILTAGHDVARLQGEVTISVSQEGDSITQMSGSLVAMRVGDMIMRDGGGISCSIIYGQDNRSPISAQTTHALYVAYIPPGIPVGIVEAHLERIESNIRLFSPDAIVEQKGVLFA